MSQIVKELSVLAKPNIRRLDTPFTALAYHIVLYLVKIFIYETDGYATPCGLLWQ